MKKKTHINTRSFPIIFKEQRTKNEKPFCAGVCFVPYNATKKNEKSTLVAKVINLCWYFWTIFGSFSFSSFRDFFCCLIGYHQNVRWCSDSKSTNDFKETRISDTLSLAQAISNEQQWMDDVGDDVASNPSSANAHHDWPLCSYFFRCLFFYYAFMKQWFSIIIIII